MTPCNTAGKIRWLRPEFQDPDYEAVKETQGALVDTASHVDAGAASARMVKAKASLASRTRHGDPAGAVTPWQPARRDGLRLVMLTRLALWTYGDGLMIGR